MFNRKQMFTRKNSIQDMDAFVEERLSGYLDGTLSDQERELVQRHLASSERARASLEALRYTVNLLKQTPAPPLPRQFTLPVTSRAPVQSAPAWLVWGLRGVGVAATAAFVFLLVATLIRPSANETAVIAPAAAPQPSVVVAFNAPTPTAVARTGSVASEGNPSPRMVTVQPTVPASQPIPITVTPEAAQKAQPAEQDSANIAPSPSPVPPQPTRVPPTKVPEPTSAPAAASASGISSASPELNAPTATSEVFTQRIAAVLEGQVLVAQLKVREGPGTAYPTIASVRQGERVQVTGRSADDAWLRIEFIRNRKTREGWVSSSPTYIRLNGAPTSLPVVELTSPEPTALPESTETAPSAQETPTDQGAPATDAPSHEPESATDTPVPPSATPEPPTAEPPTAEPPPTVEPRETPTTQTRQESATSTTAPSVEPQVETETPVPPATAA